MSAIYVVIMLVAVISVNHSLTDPAEEVTMLLTEEDTEDDITMPGLSWWLTREVIAILGK